MARYTCPSCGQPYNGKRCRACRFENFSEEITHGLHTHHGEPLVVEEPKRQPIRQKNPFACDTATKKKHRFAPALIVLAVLFVLPWGISLVSGLISGIAQAVSDAIIPEPEPELPATAIPLLDTEQFQLLADFGEDGTCPNQFPVFLRNTSDQTLAVRAEDIVINGYAIQDGYLRCQARKGRTAAGDFSVSTQDLELAGIEQIQTLSLTLSVYDAQTYDDILPVQTVALSFVDPASYHQPISDQGQVLWDSDDLRLVFRGYLPSSYSQEVPDGDLIFHLENRRDTMAHVSLESASLNGQDIDLSFWCQLPAGTRAVDQIYLYPLEDLGITDWASVRSLQLTFQLTDGTWQTDPLTIGPVELDLEALHG